MYMRIIVGLCVLFWSPLLILKTAATEICPYYTVTRNISTVICDDGCCSPMSSSLQATCCSSISWSSLAVPFFIISGVCILAICLIYCRPLWKVCLCGYKCPIGNRSRVATPNNLPATNNPVYVMNNDDLPDYETIVKDPQTKDITPPPYTFVAAHPTDFGIEARVPSAPPQYRSRRNSIITDTSTPPVEV